MTKPFSRLSRDRRADGGFTLLEMLVVLAIMGLLAAIIAPQVLKYLGGARTQTAKVQVQNIVAALDLYKLDVGRYPTQQEGINSIIVQPTTAVGWNGPYMQKASGLKDPWGQAYIYRNPGKHGEIDVYSMAGTAADSSGDESKYIGSWEKGQGAASDAADAGNR